jgi:tetratricopeptide (TPR) repeat protein
MKPEILISAALLVLLSSSFSEARSASLSEAKKLVDELRYDRAREELIELALDSSGKERQEALLLMARLKRSPDEARIIYQEVIDTDPESEQAGEAALEMAKMDYAEGKYKKALDLLGNSPAARYSREAVFFEGLCALMLEDYDGARRSFAKIKTGRFSVWAGLALAEIDMRTQKRDEACRRYEALARTLISPVAMYRFGECLEGMGRVESARRAFSDIIEHFEDTPEAILAAEKLKMLGGEEPAEAEISTPPPATTDTSGRFTIQFGAFRDRRNAIKLAEELKKKVPGVRIDTDLVDYREIHRVRFGYFRTREEALMRAEELRSEIENELTIVRLPEK